MGRGDYAGVRREAMQGYWLQRGRAFWGAEIQEGPWGPFANDGFNGAAPFGARRCGIAKPTRLPSIALQRGRAFWGAEMVSALP